MIRVVQGFKFFTREAVDSRLVLTKAEMRAIKDNQMPDIYFAVCKDNGYLYVYDKHQDIIDSETGKFSQYSGNKIESITVNGRELPINNKNIDLPLATAERYGLVLPGKGLSSIDGEITVDFNSLDDHVIPFEKIDFGEVIIDASNISIN